jgi:hypothetical protein
VPFLEMIRRHIPLPTYLPARAIKTDHGELPLLRPVRGQEDRFAGDTWRTMARVQGNAPKLVLSGPELLRRRGSRRDAGGVRAAKLGPRGASRAGKGPTEKHDANQELRSLNEVAYRVHPVYGYCFHPINQDTRRETNRLSTQGLRGDQPYIKIAGIPKAKRPWWGRDHPSR